MKIVADEGVDAPIVARLRAEGHEVLYVAELPPGLRDQEVVALAKEREALLLTTDKDFGELVFLQGLVPGGVMLLRLEGLKPEEKWARVVWALQEHGSQLAQAFSVLTGKGLRIRKLP
ncbi:DUF5615 family PIN-like protein [Thermus sp. NMX2.A1]|uniref:DUF5615 family PIN-like protein n=1 Tax=Thermus sp. NMX2.A1 TaxID=570924 RepID=UPI0003DD9261|nr:DUF5615 family PIN-like protein [Thermus sp. NMX2.A1]ETN87415.1 hypothetical protein TNMX_12305 [Thermus sp. NMX2.A1]